jgi:RimJ/RimL family protein N-acetyltransferase
MAAMTVSTPSGQAHVACVSVRVRELSSRHRSAMIAHLLELSCEDRYLRFGYAASDEHINAHVETMHFGHSTLFGIFNRSMKLVAMAQLAYTLDRHCNRCAEFGVSVAKEYRGKAYGQALFERAAQHARNEGIDRFLVHALTQNRPMLHIARKAGADMVLDGDESQAMLILPPADLNSQVGEAWTDGLAKARHLFRALWHRVRVSRARH